MFNTLDVKEMKEGERNIACVPCTTMAIRTERKIKEDNDTCDKIRTRVAEVYVFHILFMTVLFPSFSDSSYPNSPWVHLPSEYYPALTSHSA
jgi:hypothetical protein